MGQYSAFAQSLQNNWRRCQSLPGGRRLFSFLIGWTVPYSGSIGARVLELKPGNARLQLPDRRKVRNHLRSIHAIALCNLGELTTGLALNSGLPTNTRAILVSIKTDYLKKSRGTLSSSCDCALPTDNSTQDLALVADISDASGEVVARCTATWRVGA